MESDVHSTPTSIHDSKCVAFGKRDGVHLVLDAGHSCCLWLMQQHQIPAHQYMHLGMDTSPDINANTAVSAGEYIVNYAYGIDHTQ